jgi:signal transduction histidine kinase
MRRHGWPVAIGAGVGAALLVLLGALQVQWLDRVAQTVAAQKRAALHRRGTEVATVLEHYLTAAWLWFQLEEDDGEKRFEEALTQRWLSWREAGPRPDLVAAVWLIEPDATGDPRLRRLDASGVPQAAPWPEALGTLRDTLRGDVRMSGLLAPPTWDRAFLAVPGGPRATVLVELDGAHLTRELLPALAMRKKPGDELGPVLIRLEDAWGEPLFTGPPTSFFTGEHEPIVISGIRPELVSPERLAGMKPPSRWQESGPRWHPHPGGGPFTAIAGHPPPPGPGPAHVFTRAIFGPGKPAFPPGRLPPPPFHAELLGGWRLSLALAAGPVDDIVTSLRRRNLALAFSLLTLLGGAITALVVAVRRAHALAERQRQFTASMSHELRTPLAVIGSAAENLRDGTVDEAERVREYGALIHVESKRLGAMIDHTLRLAAGGALDELPRRPVDVRALVESAIDSFAQEVRSRRARLECSYAPELPPVSADPEALRQAVENVVGNALKYGGDPPRVVVTVRTAGGQVEIAVEDEGLGIPRDEVDHVFEPFFRGREALGRQIRGTGLGLALVARVMRAHGGRVSVESAPGAGSVFVLRLPGTGA